MCHCVKWSSQTPHGEILGKVILPSINWQNKGRHIRLGLHLYASDSIQLYLPGAMGRAWVLCLILGWSRWCQEGHQMLLCHISLSPYTRTDAWNKKPNNIKVPDKVSQGIKTINGRQFFSQCICMIYITHIGTCPAVTLEDFWIGGNTGSRYHGDCTGADEKCCFNQLCNYKNCKSTRAVRVKNFYDFRFPYSIFYIFSYLYGINPFVHLLSSFSNCPLTTLVQRNSQVLSRCYRYSMWLLNKSSSITKNLQIAL